MAEEDAKRKRDTWTRDETDYMLELVEELNIISKLDTKKFKSKDIWDSLVPLMQEKGFEKTSKQIQYKHGNLKKKWKEIKSSLSHSGNGTEELGKFKEFEILDRIHGTRVGFNLKGVDSSTLAGTSFSKDHTSDMESEKVEGEGKRQNGYEFDIEDDFDIGEFLYENDPEFRQKCDQECIDSGLDLHEVLNVRKAKLASDQEKTLKSLKSPDEASHSKNQSPYEKVMQNIETKEKEAISALRKRSGTEDGGQGDQAVKSAKYSSAKNKRKSTAVVYAEIAKENAKELQDELLESQKAILSEPWSRQETFMKNNTTLILAEERKIAVDATQIMVNGILAALNKNSTPKKVLKILKKFKKKKNLHESNRFDYDDEDYGFDSSFVG